MYVMSTVLPVNMADIVVTHRNEDLSPTAFSLHAHKLARASVLTLLATFAMAIRSVLMSVLMYV